MRYTLLSAAMLLLLSGCGGSDSGTDAGSETDSGSTGNDTNTNTNSSPEILSGRFSTLEDTPLSIKLTDYVSDPEQDALTIEVSQQCSDYLTCSIKDDVLLVTPTLNYFGPDNSIAITAKDGKGNQKQGQFTVSVEAVNDAPSLELSDIVLNEDDRVTIELLPFVQDVDSHSFSFTVESCAENMQCAIDAQRLTVTPKENYFGSINSVSIGVSDDDGASSNVTFNVDINSIYDMPSFNAQEISINEDTSKSIDLADWYHSVEDIPVEFYLNECASNLTCQLEGSVLSLTPSENYNGADNSILVATKDTFGFSQSEEVNVVVLPKNDLPSLMIPDQSTEEDSIFSLNLWSFSYDIDGDEMLYNVESCPSNVECLLIWEMLYLIPSREYSSPENAVTVSVTDSNSAKVMHTFNLEVTEVNDSPTWTSIPTQTMQLNSTLEVDLSPYVSDKEGNAISLSVSSCNEGITCKLENEKLILEKPQIADDVYRIDVLADDGNSSSPAAILVFSERESVDLIDGITFFPPVDAISENADMPYSMNAEVDVQSLVINGQEFEVSDPRSWQDNLSLTEENNRFEITVETETQTSTFIRTFKYQGPLHHGSKDLTYLSDGQILVNDYRRDALLSFNLTSGQTEQFTPQSVQGLPATPESYVVSGQTVVGHVVNPDSGDNELYLLDMENNEAQLLYNLTNDNIRLSRMTMSQDGASVFIVFVGAKQVGPNSWQNYEEFYDFDIASKQMVFIADTILASDDGILRSVDSVKYSDAEHKLYLLDRGLGFNDDTSLYSLALSGDQQGKIRKVPMTAGEQCVQLDSLELSEGNARADSEWYLVSKQDHGVVYEMDIEAGCLKEYFRMPSDLHAERESLQGFDINPNTGEMYLGFYSGPISYDQATDSFDSLEIKGFSGQPWEIDEITSLIVDRQRERVLFIDGYKLNAYDLKTGQLSLLYTLGGEGLSLAWDESLEKLYIGDDSGTLSVFDSATEQLQVLVDPKIGLEFEFIALSGSEAIYFIDGDEIKQYDLQDGGVEVVSANDPNAEFYSVTGLLVDELNNRLVVDSQKRRDFGRTYFISVDIETGVRTFLNESEAIALNIEGSISWDQDATGIIYQNYTNDSLYRYDLVSKSTAVIADSEASPSLLGSISVARWYSESVLLVGSYELNGFWLIDLNTNRRVLLR
ncbi:TPA: tandem-95 repeat protein [Vibrio campbellii]